MTISLYAWERKENFSPPALGASANEMTIAYSAIKGRKNFSPPVLGALANETILPVQKSIELSSL